MLEARGLSVKYGAITALRGVDLSVQSGEIVAFVGANGAGKSTLLNAISGVVPLAQGEVTFDGGLVSGRQAAEIVRRGLVQVPEGRQVFTNMSVMENLEMGGYSRKGRLPSKDLDFVFGLFPRLAERRTQMAGLMSGGEQQMLAISRALMAQPRLLMLDEPSMGLAPLVVAEIFRTLERLRKETKLTIMLVEQNAKAALRLSDRAYVLTNGRVQQSGLSRNLLQDERIREAFLGGAKLKQAVSA
ncbi:ABC transporter ATP-binding protein [Rhizobium sp. Root1204]|uniref:ABC transporter ATP-binding protein n=1 Tax=Rhizobium sp. Root1204 TaxID=1736428 RepID=UPI0007149D0B|nr:ABC transporter ATP-binding protein [Rhizobium sp. Root1204]KQV41319.1 ABC transporter ATP-binding protein [Rhizobium sp. Root1204]